MSVGAVGKDVKKNADSNSLMSDLSEQCCSHCFTSLSLFTDVNPHSLRGNLRYILSYMNVRNITL